MADLAGRRASKIADAFRELFRGFTSGRRLFCNSPGSFLATQFLANSLAAQPWRSEKTDGEWRNRRRWGPRQRLHQIPPIHIWEITSECISVGPGLESVEKSPRILDRKTLEVRRTLNARNRQMDCGGVGDTAGFSTGAASMAQQSRLLCH